MKKATANILCVRQTTSADSICYASIAAGRFAGLTLLPWNESIILNISHAQFAQLSSVRKTAIMNTKVRSTVITTTQRNLHNGATDAEPRY